MKFDVSLTDLKYATNVIKDTIGTDSQGHEGIRVYASKKTNKLKLTTTDGNYSTEIWIPGSVKESGKFVVKAKKFMAYVGKLDVEKLSFSIKDNGAVQLKSKRGQQTFQCYDESSFQTPPKLDHEFSFDIAGRVYKQLIQNVAFATDDAKQPTRPILSGIHMASDGNMFELTTTNGLVVAYYKRKLKVSPMDVVLGKKSLVNSARLIKDDEKVTIQACKNSRFLIRFNDVTYYLPTFAGAFPDVKSILPGNEFPLEFTADKDELLSVLDRASAMLDGKGVLHFEKDRVTISGRNEESEFNEYIMTKLQGKADDVRVDVKKMADIVKNIDADMIHVGVRDKQPITLRPEGKSTHTCILAVG